jgi:hypothetical protein
MKLFAGFFLILFSLSIYGQEHKTILPEPQKITYGKGIFLLKNATIGFAAKPGSEDKFAAGQLASVISEVTTVNIPVRESSGASIIFERTGKSDPLPVPGEKPGPDSREAYKIRITPGNIRITSRSSAGLFYAVQTLRQMIDGTASNATIAAAEIEDWPSMVYRGFMMDMSHFQLPRMEEIRNQIDFLARWKGNQYLFYSEASIELEGYPLLMADARFTREQVKEIIDYAKERHVDVIPNMELYGHLHDLFRLEHYADLAVVPHGGEFIPDDPRVRPLLEDWISQISKLFPSPFFHIGFDETWLLEHEAKKRNKTPEELYSIMLRQTTDIVEKNGKRAMVWVDMLQKYPAMIPDASKKMIAVPWHYNPLTDEKYEQMLGPFEKAGIDMIVQGAIRNWNWVAPDFEESSLNTDVLIKAGRKYNAIGFINSGWTDDAMTIMRMAYPDIAYGCVAAWQNEPVNKETFFQSFTRAQYPPEFASVVEKAHQSLFQAESFIRKSVGATDPALWANPFKARTLKMIAGNRENLHSGRLAVEDAMTYIRSALKYGIDTTSLTAMLAGARMLDYIAIKYIYAGEIEGYWKQLSEKPDRYDFQTLVYRETAAKYHSRLSDLMDVIEETREAFRKAWLNEYTPFRLGIALGKFDNEFQYWLKVQQRVLSLSFREGEQLPSIESVFIQGLE